MPTDAVPPPHAAARPSAPRSFARFELRELLGRSLRTMLWLAHDPNTESTVLLMLPRIAPADAAALLRWQAQAQHGARLDHPHLVTPLEVGVHEHWPYIVCDRAIGVTLDEFFAEHPLPSHNEMAGWLGQVLDGLAFAHEAGVSHDDLQSYSLLIDERRHLRVIALGASCTPVPASDASALDAARGMPVDPAQLRAQRSAAERDVLSVGILAHQWLAGAPALDEPDIAKVIDRLAPHGREILRLPWTTPTPISEALRAICNRATHNQPRQRYLGARTLMRALEGWREADAKDDGGPIAVLLERLSSVGCFPAMPGIAITVSRLARMEQRRTDEMAEQILLDLGLSFELLRRVNTAQVQGTQALGNGPVLTIRRAITMVGLDGVRSAAGGLRGWPGPLSETNAAALRALVQRVRLAGHVAQMLRPAGYDPEVIFLLAVLQNLGRLMLAYHFPEDAEQIRQLMRPLPVTRDETVAAGAVPAAIERAGMPEQAAAFAVLGVDVEAMTTAVAHRWGLGNDVITMLRRLPPTLPVHKPDADDDLLRATASAANEVVDAISLAAGPAQLNSAFDGIAKRYGRVLNLNARDLAAALRDGRQALESGAPLVSRTADDAVTIEPTIPGPFEAVSGS